MSDSKVKTPFPAAADIQWSAEPPTQPGAYWFQPEPLTRALMVEVRVTNGELTILWPNIDQPVAKFSARWRGPIPPSTGPESR